MVPFSATFVLKLIWAWQGHCSKIALSSTVISLMVSKSRVCDSSFVFKKYHSIDFSLSSDTMFSATPSGFLYDNVFCVFRKLLTKSDQPSFLC